MTLTRCVGTVLVSEPELNELFARAASGDVVAAGEAVAHFETAARRAAMGVTRSVHDAQDAYAIARERVIRALLAGRIEHPAALRTYLCTAARRAAVDTLRHASRFFDVAERPEAVDHASPECESVERDDRRRALEAFATLPPRWQRVLHLSTVEGRSPAEIGAELGLSPNAASQLASRARRALREAFDRVD